jgi:transcription initiation factor TFIID TATA-box-binding protein
LVFFKEIFIKSLYILQGGEISIMPEVQVENIVISCPIAQRLDLVTLASALAHASYKPEEMPVVMVKVDKPRSAVFLFASGLMMVTGVTSLAMAEEVVSLMIQRLSLLGVPRLEDPELCLEHAVASLDFGSPLLLEEARKTLETVSVEQGFPGLMVKSADPNTVIVLFDSGKMVADGPSVDAVTEALMKVSSDLKSGIQNGS